MATLKQGAKGSEVKRLQAKLNKAPGTGAKLKLDGIFGPKTEAATKAFQKKSKLKVDGIAGRNTLGALEGGGEVIKLDIGGRNYDDAAGSMSIRVKGAHYRHDKYEGAIDKAAQTAIELERTLRRKVDELRRANKPCLETYVVEKKFVDRIWKLQQEFQKLSKAGSDVPRQKELKAEIEKLDKQAQDFRTKQIAAFKRYKAVRLSVEAEVKRAGKEMLADAARCVSLMND